MSLPQRVLSSDIHIDSMFSVDWPDVSSIYIDGIATGNATLETLAPTWEEWDRLHLPFGRLVAREEATDQLRHRPPRGTHQRAARDPKPGHRHEQRVARGVRSQLASQEQLRDV